MTLEDTVKYLALAYAEDTTIEILVAAPFCCEGFIDAFYNGQIFRRSNHSYRLPADYVEEFNITFCPFCGLRLAALKETENEC